MAAEQMQIKKQGQDLAKILAIGTANPSNCVYQTAYPDYYFRITSSEHMTELKEKFKRICKFVSINVICQMHITFAYLNVATLEC